MLHFQSTCQAESQHKSKNLKWPRASARIVTMTAHSLLSPLSLAHEISSFCAGGVAAVSVALACFNHGWAIYMTFPCLLAATLEGTLIGSLLPAPANRILHPIIVTCLVINAGAAVFGLATGMGYQQTLQSYLTKV